MIPCPESFQARAALLPLGRTHPEARYRLSSLSTSTSPISDMASLRGLAKLAYNLSQRFNLILQIKLPRLHMHRQDQDVQGKWRQYERL